MKGCLLIVGAPTLFLGLMVLKIYIDSQRPIQVNEFANVVNMQDQALLAYYKEDYFIINLFGLLGPRFGQGYFDHRNYIHDKCEEMCYTKRYLNVYNDSAPNITYSDIDFLYLLTRFHPTWTPKVSQLTLSEGEYYAPQIRWLSEFKGKYWQPTLRHLPFLKSPVYSNLAYHNHNVIEVVARYHKKWQPSPQLLETKVMMKFNSHYYDKISVAEVLAFNSETWTSDDPKRFVRGLSYPEARGRSIAWYNLKKDPFWLPTFENDAQEAEILSLRTAGMHNDTIAHLLSKMHDNWQTSNTEILTMTNKYQESVAHLLADNHDSWTTSDKRILAMTDQRNRTVAQLISWRNFYRDRRH